MSNNDSQIPFDPQRFDVVCTKLRTWNSKHPGNRFFNELIAKFSSSITEAEIKKMSEQLIDIVTQKGGRFLRLSDADCLSGGKPSMCTVLDQKQRITKVVRTLRTAYLKHHGALAKRVRNPETKRRKKTKAYELLSGSIPINPYALQLLGAVMNSVRNIPYRELDKPGEPYTIETEPEQLRLMRLQLRHRLVGAKEAMMPAVEFGHTIMNLWGGRVVVQKIQLPNVVNSSAVADAVASDTVAADKIGGVVASPNNNAKNVNNASKTASSSTDPNNKTTPTPASSSIPKTTTTAPPSKESQPKKNEMKDQLRAATRQKLKALMNVGGAIRSSPSKARPVRGSLASKTLPNMGGADKKSPNSTAGTAANNKPTKALHNVGGAIRMSPSKVVGTTTTTATAEKKTRGSLPPSLTLPVRAAAGKTTTKKPDRGSLASKTLPGARGLKTPLTNGNKKATTTTTTAPPSKNNNNNNRPTRRIGSLVRCLEQADEDSKKFTKLGVSQMGVTDGAANAVGSLNLVQGGGGGIAPPPSLVGGHTRKGRATSSRSSS